MPNNLHEPPRLALRLFRWYCDPNRVEELEGDLQEFYTRRIQGGESAWKARLFFWYNVIRCYKSYSKIKTQKNSIMLSHFKSYTKLALRHSRKNIWSVLINVTGLGLALSMCIFMYLLYAYNWEFDDFYKNTENTYRLHSMTFENNLERRNEMAPIALENALADNLAGVESISSYSARRADVKLRDEYYSEYIGIASTNLVEMFEMPLAYGTYDGFEDRRVVYLKGNTAKKYFGNEVALGKELILYFGDKEKIEVTVGGVFDKIPLNSSFDFNILMNQKDFQTVRDIDPNDWSNKIYEGLYFNINPNNIEQITQTINSYIPQQNEGHEERKITRFELVPFGSSINAGDTIYRSYVTTRLQPSVYIIFTVLILMIFLTACFNLANTSMALIAKRLKEIGVRKTLGSGSKQIFIQFLFEMGIISLFAFLIAMLTANTTSSMILGLFSANFLLQDANLTGIIIFVLLFLVVTTLVAGFLPALYAWKFQPVQIMRKSVKLKGVNWLNRSLTVAQYSFSIAVLAAGITFSQNSYFLKNMHLGYEDDNVINLNLGSGEYFEIMKQEIDQIPGVVTAGTQNHVGGFGRFSSLKTLEIDTLKNEVRHYTIGQGYLELMDVKLISGRFFNEDSEVDQEEYVLVTKSFADQYFPGEDPLNRVVRIGSDRKAIVGVVGDIIDDVYQDSELRPSVFALDKNADLRHLVVKVNSGRVDDVEERLRSIWNKHIDQPYEGALQEEFALGEAGRDTRNLQKIFIAMAILGGFLSIVGIFGLVKLNSAKRLKEISVRKILGASLNELLYAINRSFIIVLFVALAFGSVLGYLISDTVLGLIYKYYTDVSMATVLGSGIMIVVISIITITSAVLVPATTNPVIGLREE